MMGSPVSTILANLYMELFDGDTLWSASNPPRFWFRFVDDTWIIQQSTHKQEYLEHINSIDTAIKFAVKGTQGNGGIPSLDTLVTPEADNSLSFTVYHKPTHTDQYLQLDSYHNLSAKYSVIGTLTHRAKTVCTKPELLQKELSHLREALVKCKFPPWATNRVQSKLINNNWGENNDNNNIQSGNNNTSTAMTQSTIGNHALQDQSLDPGVTITNRASEDHNNNTTGNTSSTALRTKTGYVVVPYTKGLSESFKRICGKYGIQTYFKGNMTIKQTLMKPRTKTPRTTKVN